MQFLEKEICQITEGVWNDLLGLGVSPIAEAEAQNGRGKTLTGSVRIKGGWQGEVRLQCSAELARRAAVVMFRVELDKVTPEQAQDAIGELTNMTGGNLKALLPPPCQISLPTVTEENNGNSPGPDGQLRSHIFFQCQGQPFSVTLLESSKDPAGNSEAGQEK